MYITDFFEELVIAPIGADPEKRIRCVSPSMAAYVAEVLAVLEEGEAEQPWRDGLFAILTNFAVHVLGHDHGGLVVGSSEAGKRAIRLGNGAKDIRFDVSIQAANRLATTVVGKVKSIFRSDQGPQSISRLICVHDIQKNDLPLKTIARLQGGALDFTLIFDGPKDAMEQQVAKLQCVPNFTPKSFHLRRFDLDGQAPWAVVVYAHGTAP